MRVFLHSSSASSSSSSFPTFPIDEWYIRFVKIRRFCMIKLKTLFNHFYRYSICFFHTFFNRRTFFEICECQFLLPFPRSINSIQPSIYIYIYLNLEKRIVIIIIIHFTGKPKTGDIFEIPILLLACPPI